MCMLCRQDSMCRTSEITRHMTLILDCDVLCFGNNNNDIIIIITHNDIVFAHS